MLELEVELTRLPDRQSPSVFYQRPAAQPKFPETHTDFTMFAKQQLLRYRQNNRSGFLCFEHPKLLIYLQPFLKKEHDKQLFALGCDLESETNVGRSHVALLCGHYYYMQARYTHFFARFFQDFHNALMQNASSLPGQVQKHLSKHQAEHPLFLAYTAIFTNDWRGLQLQFFTLKAEISDFTKQLVDAERAIAEEDYTKALGICSKLNHVNLSPETQALLLAAKARCYLLNSERTQAIELLKQAKQLAPGFFPNKTISQISDAELKQQIANQLKQSITEGLHPCLVDTLQTFNEQERQAYLDASEFGDVAALRQYLYLSIRDFEALPTGTLPSSEKISHCLTAIDHAKRHNPHAVHVLRCLFHYRMSILFTHHLFYPGGIIPQFRQEHGDDVDLPDDILLMIIQHNEFLHASCDDFPLAQQAFAQYPTVIRNAFFIGTEFIPDKDLTTAIINEDDCLKHARTSPLRCFDDFKTVLRHLAHEAGCANHELFNPRSRQTFSLLG